MAMLSDKKTREYYVKLEDVLFNYIDCQKL